MEKVYAKNIRPSLFVGYREIWYSNNAVQKMPVGISVPESQIEQATMIPHFGGMELARKEVANFQWRPFIGAYTTEAYLVKGTVVITNELKKQDEVGLRSFPKHVVTILSETKARLRKVAEHLKLPLEELVSTR